MNAPTLAIARAAMAAALIMPHVFFVSCMSRQGITRDTRPVESAGVETTRNGYALLRSIYCDILAAPVDEEAWARLLSGGTFARGPAPRMRQRVPPVTAILLVLKSTVNAPLTLKNAQLLHGNSGLSALTADRLSELLKSPAYSGIDVRKMLLPRRIIREGDAAVPVDLERDTIELKLDFVPPRDTVMILLVFEKMPAEARTFRLRLTISALGSEKNQDIDFTRLEFRAGSEDAAWKKKRERASYDE